MPKGQKPLCLIHFWRLPFSHFQPLLLHSSWGNKNWIIMGCWAKRQTINGTKSVEQAENVPVSMPLGFIQFGSDFKAKISLFFKCGTRRTPPWKRVAVGRVEPRRWFEASPTVKRCMVITSINATLVVLKGNLSFLTLIVRSLRTFGLSEKCFVLSFRFRIFFSMA